MGSTRSHPVPPDLDRLKDRTATGAFFQDFTDVQQSRAIRSTLQQIVECQTECFAYTDSCAGDFVRQLKETPLWKNSVVLFVPDHLGVYPESIDHLSPERYTIPLILTGGAVKEPQRITAYGSQIDIAATLLAQLGLPHDDFTFSKNILNPSSPHFAFHFPQYIRNGYSR